MWKRPDNSWPSNGGRKETIGEGSCDKEKCQADIVVNAADERQRVNADRDHGSEESTAVENSGQLLSGKRFFEIAAHPQKLRTVPIPGFVGGTQDKDREIPVMRLPLDPLHDFVAGINGKLTIEQHESSA